MTFYGEMYLRLCPSCLKVNRVNLVRIAEPRVGEKEREEPGPFFRCKVCSDLLREDECPLITELLEVMLHSSIPKNYLLDCIYNKRSRSVTP